MNDHNTSRTNKSDSHHNLKRYEKHVVLTISHKKRSFASFFIHQVITSDHHNNHMSSKLITAVLVLGLTCCAFASQKGNAIFKLAGRLFLHTTLLFIYEVIIIK
jgi:hypothetical protein